MFLFFISHEFIEMLPNKEESTDSKNESIPHLILHVLTVVEKASIIRNKKW